MAKKQITGIEKYLNTDDEHFNEHAFDFYKDLMKKDLFEKPEMAFAIFNEQIEPLVKNWNYPVKAFDQLKAVLEKQCDTDAQKVFLYDWIKGYLELTESEVDTWQVENLIQIEIKRLKKSTQLDKPDHPATNDLRERLKTIMLNELDKLPETLEGLEEKPRLELLIKLMPFVFPKVQNVHHTVGESSTFRF